MPDTTDSFAIVHESLSNLTLETQTRYLDAAKANIAKGMGNWVDALIVASAAKAQMERNANGEFRSNDVCVTCGIERQNHGQRC